MKFLLGENSAIGSFDNPARKITCSYGSKSSTESWKISLFKMPTCRGRWFPNQNRSTTSTLYPRSSSFGIKTFPTYPAPPAIRTFMQLSFCRIMDLDQYLKFSDAGEANHAASVCAFLSFSESSAFATGHSMPIAGSFHRMPDSPLLLYAPVHLYWISAESESTQKPRANPAGAQTSRRFSADASIPTHFPSVGEPLRMSTATRNALPWVTRMSLPMGGSH